MAWFYLRHVQLSPTSGLRGDSSELFSFSSFFPELVAPLIARALHEPRAPSSLLPLAANGNGRPQSVVVAVGAPLPASTAAPAATPDEVERRR